MDHALTMTIFQGIEQLHRPRHDLLLGERTWGKGTVQKLFPMPDKSALKLTMWQYLLAGDIVVVP